MQALLVFCSVTTAATEKAPAAAAVRAELKGNDACNIATATAAAAVDGSRAGSTRSTSTIPGGRTFQ